MGILCSWYVSLEPRCFTLVEESVHSYIPSSSYLCTLTASDGCLEGVNSTGKTTSSIM